MRWSKLRALALDRFAEPLRGRLDIHSAAYGNCTCGHAWLSFDGDVIANFCTRAHYIAGGWEAASSDRNRMYKRQLTPFGALSRQDAYRSCWQLIHELSIEEALASDDLLTQSLAIADTRVGMRRLQRIDPDALEPLPAFLLLIRLGNDISVADFIAARQGSPATEPADFEDA
ncbi:hypothetical protein [Sphingosinithalassobacter portus]|uniref:SF0329 family protein n=1 Tax=Stakelama portus TaxID=2676234 RepID=UPI001873E830|nr:hypothetical protein [Sphingosinithalassobacter portus]